MSAQPQKIILLRRVGMLLLLTVTSLFVGVWAGCSTPQERYQTLSFFFDGVPNPDAPKPGARSAQEEGASGTVITASVVSRHKPFVERKCAACHNSASGNIMEFEEAYKSCTKCHTKITKEYPRMHGPVAAATVAGPVPTCKLCHAPHESAEPALLKDTPVKVCTQCHDAQLLGPKPVQHLDGTSCIQCHYGHGSSLQISHLLKPGAIASWSASRPATMPATQPTTGPASLGVATTQPHEAARGNRP